MATPYTEIPINHAATPASAAIASSDRRARFSSKLRLLSFAVITLLSAALLIAYIHPTRARTVASDMRRTVTLTLPSLFATTTATTNSVTADEHVARQMSMTTPSLISTGTHTQPGVFAMAAATANHQNAVRATGPVPAVQHAVTGPAPVVNPFVHAATGPAPLMNMATGPAPFVHAATGPAPFVHAATGPAPVVAAAAANNPVAAMAFGLNGPFSAGITARAPNTNNPLMHFMLSQFQTSGNGVHELANACATTAHGACVGTVSSSLYRAVRQCATGMKASECRCFGTMAKLSKSGLIGPHCMCEYETSRPGMATWSMYLSCTNGRRWMS